MAASLVTFVRPVSGMPPWSTDNACGPVGAALAFVAVWSVGRFAAFGIPLVAGAWAWNRLRDAPTSRLIVRTLIGSLLVFELCVGFALGGWDRWTWSGGWGMATGLALQSALSHVGSWVVAGALFGVTVLVASEVGFHWIAGFVGAVVSWMARAWHAWRNRPARVPERSAQSASKAARASARATEAKPATAPVVRRSPTAEAAEAPASRRSETRVPEPVETDRHNQIRLPLPGLRAAEPKPKRAPAPRPEPVGSSEAVAAAATDALPPLGLLGLNTQPEDLITAADLTNEANLLVAKLADFDIDGRVTEIHPGPVVTTFEFEPAAGVKVNQIVSREDDLALALRAQRIRILAPIPGKGAVGVEIPNRQPPYGVSA